MKKLLYIVMTALIFSTILNGCASDEKRFYSEKASIQRVDAVADPLNDLFREALEESDEFNEEIKDSFVRTRMYQADYYCSFEVLTEDGKYLKFPVYDAQRIYIMTLSPIPSKVSPFGSYYLEDGILKRVKDENDYFYY